MTEAQLQDAIRLALGARTDVLVLWRNNVGVAERNGHMIRFGVGNKGGADLIGLYRGRFVAVEIKTPHGRQTLEQRQFEALVQKLGGIYVVLRSVDDAHQWLAQLEATHAV